MNIFYDSIIYGFLFIDGVFFVLAILWMKNKRTEEWKKRGILLAGAFLFAWLVIFYGSFIEPQRIAVREQPVILSLLKNNARSAETLRVALIADFHLGPYKKETFVERAVAKINAQNPDAIFIAGDFVYDDVSQIQYLYPLKNLEAPLGVFAVLGNHDYSEGGPKTLLQEGEERAKMVRKKLESLGIRVLVNDSSVMTKDGKKILLIGLDELWTGRVEIPEVAGAFNGKIVLSHNPDIIHEAARRGIDLVLAGHTHGGQIRLPGIGSVPNIPDELGRAYDRGLFQFENTQLFITSGLGEMGPRARLLAPPEIAVLEIKI